MTTPADANLEAIDVVARRLRLRASAIRYYEERGLLTPASRHAGQRWYGPTEIRRLAIIQYWQRYGLMSLDEIGDILAGPAAGRRWGQVVRDRIDSLGAQIERMEATRVPGARAQPSPRLRPEWLRPLRGHAVRGGRTGARGLAGAGRDVA
jgi:DNA-binding transcriptional MerR regulator